MYWQQVLKHSIGQYGQEGTLDEDVVAIASGLALQFKDQTASIPHQIALRTQVGLKISVVRCRPIE